MKKKLIKKYLLLGIPFLGGSILYGMGIYNIFSSMLFFLGGYIFIKSICDYRIVNKNIKMISYGNDLGFDKSDGDSVIVNVKKKEVGREKQRNNIYINEKNKDSCVCFDNRNTNGSCYEGVRGLKRTRRYVRVRRKW